MRRFNTSGSCDPVKHYTLMRQSLIVKGEALVEDGRYFTIFAPRQSGKTTYFQLLFHRLQAIGYVPVWISFESLKTIPREKFYNVIGYELQRSLASYGIHSDNKFADQVDLQNFFDEIRQQIPKLMLVIDEFEDLPEVVISELLHAFRKMYQQKEFYALKSLALVGVGSLAQLVVTSASPFNIVDELRIPYFTFAEVQELIQQYIAESGQPFDDVVIKAIYDNTAGQPGLVCALCHHLVETLVTDRSQPVTMDAFYLTLKHFLYERLDKNILNIVQKARTRPEFMLRLLFNNDLIPFTIDNPDIAYLHANGVIDNVDDYVQITVPLYSKRLITAFRPTLNGETKQFVTAYDTFAEYVSEDELNLHAILTRYREYVHRRGYRAFNTEQLKEGAWHYSLDGFINFFIERLGGHTLIEVPSGRGRTDILILRKGKKYIIETKVFIDHYYYQLGKQQLADYLVSEGLDEGFYVVFSNKHKAKDTLYLSEEINGKRVYTYLIRTNFNPPSRQKADKMTG